MTMFLMISLPLLLALAALSRRLRPLVVALAPWSALPVFGLALWSPSHFSVELPWIFLGMHFGLGEVGRILIIGTALLWTLSGISARAFLVHDPRHHWFFIFYLLTMTGNLGLFMVQDLPTFTLFYALTTFAAYGLIIYENNPAAHRAGRIYLILAVIGEALLVEAVLLITSAAGSPDIAGVSDAVAGAPIRNLIMALLLAGFGIKMGVLPFHVWMPLVYSAAPTGASAVLSGSMVLAGFWGWFCLLPLGGISLPAWGIFYITIGAVAMVYGTGVGLTQKIPEIILAYSGIGQVGLITMGLGICLFLPEVWALTFGLLVLWALHLALVMGALYLGLGVAKKAMGLVWQQRLVGLGLCVPALSLAGAPLTGGAVVKGMFHTAVAMTPWVEQLSWLWTIAAIGTSVLMGRFLVEAWLRAQNQGTPHAARLTAGIWLPWAILLFGGAMSAWVVAWSLSFDQSKFLWSLPAVWESLWPILVGGFLVWGVEKNPRLLAAMPIPPGDIVIWAEWLMDRAQERRRVFTGMAFQSWPSDFGIHWFSRTSGGRVVSMIKEVEERLGQWVVLGTSFLFLAAVFLILLIISTWVQT